MPRFPGVPRPRAVTTRAASPTPNYAKLDEVLKQPVLKRELFSTPVIIETLEMLRLDDSFLCRVRSKDGAVGISVANNSQQRSLYPIQVNRLQPFFLGKDARDLEALLEEVYVYQSNYKLQSLALWVPLATIEFAILDMLGRIANTSMGQLFGEIHNPKVKVYRANGERDVTAEAVMENLKRQVVGIRGQGAQDQDWRAHEPRGIPRRALGEAHSDGAKGIWRPDGLLRRLERLVRCGGRDQVRPVARGVQIRVLRGAGAIRLVRGNEGGDGCGEHSGRRRRTGGEHARLPLADCQ